MSSAKTILRSIAPPNSNADWIKWFPSRQRVPGLCWRVVFCSGVLLGWICHKRFETEQNGNRIFGLRRRAKVEIIKLVTVVLQICLKTIFHEGMVGKELHELLGRTGQNFVTQLGRATNDSRHFFQGPLGLDGFRVKSSQRQGGRHALGHSIPNQPEPKQPFPTWLQQSSGSNYVSPNRTNSDCRQQSILECHVAAVNNHSFRCQQLAATCQSALDSSATQIRDNQIPVPTNKAAI